MASEATATAVLCVLAGDETLLLRMAVVREVVRPPVLTRMPHAPAALPGLCTLRGAVLPVVSLRVVCGGRDRDQAAGIDGRGTSSGTRIVVVETTQGRVGLLVDAVLRSDTGTGRRIEPETLLAGWFKQTARPAGSNHRGVAADAWNAEGNTAARTALLGFRVGGRAFALVLDAVVSVSASPLIDAIAPEAGPPDADDATLGVTAVRGETLPVLDAAVLLGLNRGVGGARRMVVVTRIDNRAAGLAVDAVTGILRLPADAIRPVPPLLLRGLRGQARIEGICRTEDGRLVQLLHPDRLLDARTRQRLAGFDTGASRTLALVEAENAADAWEERFLVILLGADRFGVPLAAVDEVMRHPGSLTPLPNAPAFIEGMTTLRGRVLPVIDGRRRFGVQAATVDATRRIVVLKIGALRMGLAVDRATDMARFARAAIMPASAAGPGNRLFGRVAMQGAGGTMRLVDPAVLLDAVARDMLAAMPNRPGPCRNAGAPS